MFKFCFRDFRLSVVHVLVDIQLYSLFGKVGLGVVVVKRNTRLISEENAAFSAC